MFDALWVELATVPDVASVIAPASSTYEPLVAMLLSAGPWMMTSVPPEPSEVSRKASVA